jgi:hypothetical protein
MIAPAVAYGRMRLQSVDPWLPCHSPQWMQ